MRERARQLHLSRFRRIADVLARHGLSQLAAVLGLERFGSIFSRARGHHGVGASSTGAAHLRLALSDLGVTFVKLGQVLSTRPDLLPPAYVTELAKLQDAAPPECTDTMVAIIEAELGAPVDELFASFDREPLAAASIGQAYAATLPDGSEVVVKVRRPGVVEQVAEDLDILHNLAATAARHWELADRYDVVGLAEEFAQTLRAELDYLHEGCNAERIAQNLAANPAVHVPRIYWDRTTSRVLTLERIRGLRIDDLEALDAASIDRASLAARAADVQVRMLFEDGFFHADPHPGNFFIEPDGRIGLIDFGMVGSVDEATRDRLAVLLIAVTAHDIEAVVDALFDLGVAGKHVDREGLQRDLNRLLVHYWGKPLGEIRLGPLLSEALGVARTYHLHLPAHLALLLKTIVMSEGLGARLDPGFCLTTVLAPYARRLILQQYSPRRVLRGLGRSGLEAARLGMELPRRLQRIVHEIERGDLEIGVRPRGVEPLVRRMERLGNRIVLGVLTAAFINGLAVLLSVYPLPGRAQWAGGFFAVGFVLACGLGAYLVRSILRSGRG